MLVNRGPLSQPEEVFETKDPPPASDATANRPSALLAGGSGTSKRAKALPQQPDKSVFATSTGTVAGREQGEEDREQAGLNLSVQLGYEKFKGTNYVRLVGGLRTGHARRGPKPHEIAAAAAALRPPEDGGSSTAADGQSQTLFARRNRSRAALEAELTQFAKVLDAAVTAKLAGDPDSQAIFTGGLESLEQLQFLQKEAHTLLNVLATEERRNETDGSRRGKGIDDKAESLALRRAVDDLNRKLSPSGNLHQLAAGGSGGKKAAGAAGAGTSANKTTSRVEIYVRPSEVSGAPGGSGTTRNNSTASRSGGSSGAGGRQLRKLEKKVEELEQSIFGCVNPQAAAEMEVEGESADPGKAATKAGGEPMHETLNRVEATLSNLDVGRLEAIAESLQSLLNQRDKLSSGAGGSTATTGTLHHEATAHSTTEAELDELYELTKKLFPVSAKKVPQMLTRCVTFKKYQQREDAIARKFAEIELLQVEMRKKIDLCRQGLEALGNSVAENLQIMTKNMDKIA